MRTKCKARGKRPSEESGVLCRQVTFRLFTQVPFAYRRSKVTVTFVNHLRGSSSMSQEIKNNYSRQRKPFRQADVYLLLSAEVEVMACISLVGKYPTLAPTFINLTEMNVTEPVSAVLFCIISINAISAC